VKQNSEGKEGKRVNLYGSIAMFDRTSVSVLLNEKVILDSFHFAKSID